MRISKVLWGEGMFLRPQHFQQQDLYFEKQLADQARFLDTYPWGIRLIDIDEDALRSGLLTVTRLEMMFPDGELLRAPAIDPLPEPVSLSEAVAGEDGTVVHIGLPLMRPFGTNFLAPGEAAPNPARYVQRDEPAADLFTNAVESQLSFLKKQVRLLLDKEPLDQYVSMPIARVIRSQTGGLELSKRHLPPLLTIRASGTLFMLLRRLVDMLAAKSKALQEHHREASKTLLEFRSSDIASFWLLHTTNTAFSTLQHLYHHANTHPERLFQAMSALAGGLLTFAKNYSISDLPIYNHQDPAPGFFKLDMMIRELLDTVISARYIAIPLSQSKTSYFNGRLESDKLRDADFYLAVSCDMPPADLVETVPLRFKIGAPDDVEKMVLSAMPGVKLRPAPQVPAPIPVRAGNYYFSLDPHGEWYDRMMQSRTISIYVPSGFQSLKLELMAVTL